MAAVRGLRTEVVFGVYPSKIPESEFRNLKSRTPQFRAERSELDQKLGQQGQGSD